MKNLFAPIQIIKSGKEYVCVKWNNVYIIRCYFSPNKVIGKFKRYLNILRDIINGIKNYPCIIMGDFNARHTNWDSKITTPSGQRLFD